MEDFEKENNKSYAEDFNINYLKIKRDFNNINLSNLANMANNVKIQRMENTLLMIVSATALKFLKDPAL